MRHICALMLILLLWNAPGAWAAGTAVVLKSQVSEVVLNNPATIEVELCSDSTISTVQAIVSLSSSTSALEAVVVKANPNTLQFIVEEGYDEATKEAKIVGGKPGGIIMDANGCALLGTLEIKPSKAGNITARVDVAADKTQALGSGNDYINHNETASKENAMLLTIGVVEQGQFTQPEAPQAQPAAPSNLRAVPLPCGIEECSARLTWNPGDDSVTGYRIYFMTASHYAANPNAILQQPSISITGRQTVSADLERLNQSTEYVVVLTADTNGILSGPSNAATVRTEDFARPAPVEPTQPTETIQPFVPASSMMPTTARPAAYTEDGQFLHAASGPEHIVIGMISMVLCGWLYLRKKLA